MHPRWEINLAARWQRGQRREQLPQIVRQGDEHFRPLSSHRNETNGALRVCARLHGVFTLAYEPRYLGIDEQMDRIALSIRARGGVIPIAHKLRIVDAANELLGCVVAGFRHNCMHTILRMLPGP